MLIIQRYFKFNQVENRIEIFQKKLKMIKKHGLAMIKILD